MDSFEKILTRLKSSLQVTQDQEVAAVLGLTKQAFAERKKREAFPELELYRIAASRPELKLDATYVLTGVHAHTQALVALDQRAAELAEGSADFAGAYQSARGEVREAAKRWAAAESGWSDFVQVPRYDIRASAGAGALVDQEHVLNHMAFRADWLRNVLGLNAERLALIDVDGDSMAPTLTHGDMILVDTAEGNGVRDGIHVINLGGRLLVKRLRPLVDGSIEVASDNERYGSETVSGEKLNQLKIVGRVVWQGRRV